MSAFIMKFGVNYLRPATVGTGCSLSLTGMSKFTGGGTQSRSDQLPVRSYGALSLLRGARIFTLCGRGPRRTSSNPDFATPLARWLQDSERSRRVSLELYSDRTPRRYSHHRNSCWSSSSSHLPRQVQGPSHRLPEQSQTTSTGLDHVCRRQQRLARPK